MSPFDLARQLWDAQSGAACFDHLAHWCANHGYIYAGQDAFIAARTWKLGTGLFDVVDDPDCWIVFLASANGITTIQRFLDLAPFPLPTVAFHRRGRMRVYNWQHLRFKLYGHENFRSS